MWLAIILALGFKMLLVMWAFTVLSGWWAAAAAVGALTAFEILLAVIGVGQHASK